MRTRPGIFFAAGLLIFIPLGLVDVLDDHIQEPLSELDNDVDAGRVGLLVAAATAHAVVALLGDVLYTGIVAAVVLSVRKREHRSLRDIARHLPYLRLAAADVLLALGTAFGLILFVIPGLLVLGWFALIAPVIELEGRKLFDGFRRSRQLVKGNTMRILLLVVPLLLLDDVLSSAVQSKELLGDPLRLLRRLGERRPGRHADDAVLRAGGGDRLLPATRRARLTLPRGSRSSRGRPPRASPRSRRASPP